MADAVFGADYSAAYDSLYGAKDYDAEVALIEAAMKRHGSGREKTLLDLGCGTGSHALRLAAHGFDVTGVDLSPAMLARAAEKAKAHPQGAQARFLEGDVRKADAGGSFDAAAMMFAVLGYQIDNASVLAALKNVRRHLKTGGVFVADFWYGPGVLTDRPGERVRTVDAGGQQFIRTTRTDLDTTAHTAAVNFGVWQLAGDKVVSRTQERHQMRYFFPQEIALFMELAGLRLVSLTEFPSLDKPVSDRSWNAVMVGKAE